MPPPIALPPLPKILLCSIGNPAPYQNTLHSTGHIILNHIQKTYPETWGPFNHQQLIGNAHVSRSRDPDIPIWLWQSPREMNISGIAVMNAFKEFVNMHRTEKPQMKPSTPIPNRVIANKKTPLDAFLIILHDDLEEELGEVRVKSGMRSVKGHNGLKSVKEFWEKWTVGKREARAWWRIGVGIGRPQARDKETVRDYVLQAVGQRERKVLEGCGGAVLRSVQELVDKEIKKGQQWEIAEAKRQKEAALNAKF